MKQYLVLYQWYEITSYGIIKAETEDKAILKFAEITHKLDCNHTLEKKYGYGGSISPFYYDEDEEGTFEEQFNKFIESGEGGKFTVTEITENTEGIITEKFYPSKPSELGFYNGQD